MTADSAVVGDPIAGGRIGGDGGEQGATDNMAVIGLLDGRFVVAYTETDGDGSGDVDIEARILDTRSSEEPEIGRNAGGPRDFIVGTAFDDIIDARDREDTIHGALGDDILIGGINDDTVDGGAGNDHLFGGTGTDNLTGGLGDDLLVGGYGRDYISGGEGEDTLSYQGEARPVDVDLQSGLVRSDPAISAAAPPDLAVTIIGLPDAIRIDLTIEDILGEVVEVNHDLEIFEFQYTQDVENVIGSLGDDIIRGSHLDNKLDGHKGNDILEGREGDDLIDGGEGFDKAVFSGERSEYFVSFTEAAGDVPAYYTVAHNGDNGTDTVMNVEEFEFAGTTFTPNQLLGTNPAAVLQFTQAADATLFENRAFAAGEVIGTLSAVTGANGAPPVSGFIFTFDDLTATAGNFEIVQTGNTAEVRFIAAQTFNFEDVQSIAFSFVGTNSTDPAAPVVIAGSRVLDVEDVNEAFTDVIIPGGGATDPIIEGDFDVGPAHIRVVGDPDTPDNAGHLYRQYNFEVTGDLADPSAVDGVELNRFVVAGPPENITLDLLDPDFPLEGTGSEFGLVVDTEVHPVFDFEQEVALGRFGAVVEGVDGIATATKTLTVRTWENLNGNVDLDGAPIFDLGVDAEDSFDVTVTLQDSNDAHTAVDAEVLAGNSTIAVDENAVGVVVANLVVTDEDIHSSAFRNYTFTVTDTNGVPDARFVVTGNGVVGYQLALAAGAFLDFETDGAFIDLIVTATDDTVATFDIDAGPGTTTVSVSGAVRVNINDVADTNVAPTDIVLTGGTVDENQAGVLLGSLSATDTTFTPVSFALVDEAGPFEVRNGNELWLKPGVALDFETAPQHVIAVTATDSGLPPLSTTMDVTVTVTDVNEAPVLTVTPVNQPVAENTTGTVVANLASVDPDTGDSVTYSLVGNPAGFAIVGATVVMTDAVDFETTPSIALTVRATDNGGLPSEQPLTVTIANVNEAPVDIVFGAVTAVVENTFSQTVVASFTVDDPDAPGAFAAHTVTTTHALFEIVDNGGGSYSLALKAGQDLDFEALTADEQANGILVEVTALDDGGEVTRSVRVPVSDVEPEGVNQAPQNIALTLAGVLLENTSAGTVVGDLTAFDPNGDPITFSLVDSAGGAFRLVGNQIVVSNAALLDFETNPTPQIVVRATDVLGASSEQPIVINLGNVTEIVTVGVANGTNGADILIGDGGRNILNGAAGIDFLDGGADRDLMTGGTGNDTYVVDDLRDVVRENNNAAGGIDTVIVETLTSYSLSNGVENLVFANTANGNLTGNGLDNTIIGNIGDDTISGGGGNDTLLGEGGNDTLNGNGGDDIIEGGAGDDTMNGGNGNDTFVFRAAFGNDIINGFDASPNNAGLQDRLDISDLGITADNFDEFVTITDQGNFTTVDVAGAGSIRLNGVNGTNANVITIDDFDLA